MAEKELRMELDGIVGELMEIKEELKPRLAEMKKIGTPVILVLIGLIGTKIGLRIARASVRGLWGARFLIVVLALVGFISYNRVRYGKPARSE
ncbi:MAG TPA: hypothetical protein PK350_09555 [Deltaproteobacteria bacterium]|nr:hypothetical protein [Deltaproteobacteria bacterium]HPR56006.1 hypothetical protein [Deltaproteobacteria bacterium]